MIAPRRLQGQRRHGGRHDAADRVGHGTDQRRQRERHRQRDRRRQRRRGRRPRAVPGRRNRRGAAGQRLRRTRSRGTRGPCPTARTHSRRGRSTPRATRSSPRRSPSTSSNSSSFQNEILATGFDLPTAIKFLPDGRMLVAELQGKIKVLPPPYTTPDPTPFLQTDEHRARRRAAGDLRPRARSELQRQPLLLRLLHARIAEPRPRLALHRQRACSPGRWRAARWCSTRTAQDANAEHHGGALELRQRRQALLHDRRALRRRGLSGADTARAARSTASTRTARSPPTTRSTTAPGRTTTRSGRSACATPTAPTTTRQPAGCSSATSAATTPRPRSRRSTSALAAPTTAGPTVEGPCPAPCTSPIYSYPHYGPRRGGHRRVRLPRQPVPELLLRAATSSPTTPRT